MVQIRRLKKIPIGKALSGFFVYSDEVDIWSKPM